MLGEYVSCGDTVADADRGVTVALAVPLGERVELAVTLAVAVLLIEATRVAEAVVDHERDTDHVGVAVKDGEGVAATVAEADGKNDCPIQPVCVPYTALPTTAPAQHVPAVHVVLAGGHQFHTLQPAPAPQHACAQSYCEVAATT